MPEFVRVRELGSYPIDGGAVLTARLHYLRAEHNLDVLRARCETVQSAHHEALKHLNPVLYSYFKVSRRPQQWGADAWVGLYDGDRPVACYSVDSSRGRGWGVSGIGVYREPLGGYDVRNEAIHRAYTGRRVAALALFASVGAALGAMEEIRRQDGEISCGGTAQVVVDGGRPWTAEMVALLERDCGFATVPKHRRWTTPEGYKREIYHFSPPEELPAPGWGDEIHGITPRRIVMYKRFFASESAA